LHIEFIPKIVKNKKVSFKQSIIFLLDTQGQHWIRVKMQPDVTVHLLQILVDPADDNYMPALIIVLGGDNLSSLKGTMLRERFSLKI
jgi:hypothetical protein